MLVDILCMLVWMYFIIIFMLIYCFICLLRVVCFGSWTTTSRFVPNWVTKKVIGGFQLWAPEHKDASARAQAVLLGMGFWAWCARAQGSGSPGDLLPVYFVDVGPILSYNQTMKEVSN